jgi:hypothetical protein
MQNVDDAIPRETEAARRVRSQVPQDVATVDDPLSREI